MSQTPNGLFSDTEMILFLDSSRTFSAQFPLAVLCGASVSVMSSPGGPGTSGLRRLMGCLHFPIAARGARRKHLALLWKLATGMKIDTFWRVKPSDCADCNYVARAVQGKEISILCLSSKINFPGLTVIDWGRISSPEFVMITVAVQQLSAEINAELMSSGEFAWALFKYVPKSNQYASYVCAKLREFANVCI